MTSAADVKITAVFAFDVFANADKTYCVYKFRDCDTDKEFTAVGPNLPDQKNLRVDLYGNWTNSKKTGKKQFEVSYTEIARPTQRREIIAYLVSLKCGVGRARAQAIYMRFGERTWDVIDNEPEQIKKIPGISEKIYKRMLKAIADDNISRVLLAKLAKAGVTVNGNSLHKLIDKLGKDAVQLLSENPYRAYGMEGFSFDKCDALALSLGIAKDDPRRLRAMVKRVLNMAAINGHVCLPKILLLQLMIKWSGCGRDECAAAINSAFADNEIRSANGHIYSAERYEVEASIANSVIRLLGTKAATVANIDSLIGKYEETHFKLADSQRDAIKMVFSSQMSIITGGPGTGKTTVTNAVLWVHRTVFGEKSEPLLLAPTGKAARRMSEATNYPAATIHSAVGWRGDDEAVPCGKDELQGNLVLVDEASMMDQKIASILLERIQSGAKVVLIGDVDQLPSVGCGNVLRDMIESHVVPTTRLTVIYRQAGNNPIVTNAHRINSGNADIIEAKSFKFIETYSEGETFEQAIRMYIRCVRAYGDDKVILLNPQRHNTDLSVDNFNAKLQAIMNPPAEDKPEIKVGKYAFRVGDKVMELKNTQNAKNGDVGRIRAIARTPDPDDPSEWECQAMIEFEGDEGNYLAYSQDDLRHVTHAWCMTVHKVQGSEYPTVIEVVSKAHPSMLKKNLIYTGITRARSNVALIGERDALRLAVSEENAKADLRYTLLAKRLRSEWAKKTLHGGNNENIA